ncbi:mechanosensitive ion channel protein 8-like isoform X1 [Malania oleifera]|uniref:mechanosensitive ion channel protein 8-like isoform X1 n=1 Tax=Malania oleifera TaxID=397392 RepID=UPI0025AE0D56|nr:mechanosensitive ion channel protein 8-like isoform X1 [Malania oleifera]
MAQFPGCGSVAEHAFTSESRGEICSDGEAIGRRNRGFSVQGNQPPSSSATFRRRSGLLRTKTNSRMMDFIREEQDQRPKKMVKLGVFRKSHEEDDLLDADLQRDYRRMKLGTTTLLQWVSLALMILALLCSLFIPAVKRHTLWDLQLWKWVVVILFLFCGSLISSWVIRIAVLVIEHTLPHERKRVLYFVYGLRKAVQNCIFVGLVLVAWYCIFYKTVEKETHNRILPYVTKILVCLLVCSLLWLLKIFFVKVLASYFHVETFFERIQVSLDNQLVIRTLQGVPSVEVPNKQVQEGVMVEVQTLQNAGATSVPDYLRESFLPTNGTKNGGDGVDNSHPGKTHQEFLRAIPKKQDQGITIDHLRKLTRQNVSAWKMKKLVKIVRQGSLSTLDEQILDSTEIEGDCSFQARCESNARQNTEKIFNNVTKKDPNKEYIYKEDLLCFMKEDEALTTMQLFKGATEGKGISKQAFRNWMVNVLIESKALALSLKDTKTSVDELHRILNVIIAGISVIIWLLILGIATPHLLVFVSSQFLLVVFIFGSTCKAIFEAIIFLFVMHPFDVGDRCEVDGVQMEVEEMNILTTVFVRYDNQKIRYPNSVLATKPIGNFNRSANKIDAVDFSIHISTPMHKMDAMKEKIKTYIESKNDHWNPDFMAVVKEVEDLNRVNMAVWVTHKTRHHNMRERWIRRTLLIEKMIEMFRELDIEYRMLPLDMNLREISMGAVSNRLPSNWTTCAG